MMRLLSLSVLASLCLSLCLFGEGGIPVPPQWLNTVAIGPQSTIDQLVDASGEPTGFRITVHVRFTSDSNLGKTVHGDVWDTNIPEGEWIEAGNSPIGPNIENYRLFYYNVWVGTEMYDWIAAGENVELRARMTDRDNNLLATNWGSVFYWGN